MQLIQKRDEEKNEIEDIGKLVLSEESFSEILDFFQSEIGCIWKGRYVEELFVPLNRCTENYKKELLLHSFGVFHCVGNVRV